MGGPAGEDGCYGFYYDPSSPVLAIDLLEFKVHSTANPLSPSLCTCADAHEREREWCVLLDIHLHTP